MKKIRIKIGKGIPPFEKIPRSDLATIRAWLTFRSLFNVPSFFAESSLLLLYSFVRAEGLEPTTNDLRGRYSTIELYPLARLDSSTRLPLRFKYLPVSFFYSKTLFLWSERDSNSHLKASKTFACFQLGYRTFVLSFLTFIGV